MINRPLKKINPAEICESLPAAEVFILDVSELCFTEVFDRCTAIEAEADKITAYQRPLPSTTGSGSEMTMQARIILERQGTENQAIRHWLETVKAGGNFQFDASLLALDDTASIIAQWRLHGCWPSKVHTLPAHSTPASPTAVMQERIVLNYENVERLD